MGYIGTPLEDPLQIDAGSSLTFESQTKPTGLNDSLDADRSENDAENVAHTKTQSVVMSPAVLDGFIPFSYGEEFIFNRIWITPSVIDPSFTTEDTEYNVEVWNAYLTEDVTWTAENITGDTDGVNFAIDATPFTITKSDAPIYIMTLYQSGPPIQDTTYTETIHGDDYDIDVTTMRVLWLNPGPNWVERVRTGYSFETAISLNDRFVEQRRPLRHDIRRTLSLELYAETHQLHILSNVLQFGHDKVFACPIYQEGVICTTIPNGATTIVTETDTTYHWNLNNACQQIMIVDHEAGEVEVKEITSVAANAIETAMDIEGSFNVASTIVYPVFIGLLVSHSIRHETNTKATIKVSFEEYIGG